LGVIYLATGQGSILEKHSSAAKGRVPMKRLVMALLLSALPALAADNSLSGTWKVVGDVGSYPVNRVCTFNQDGKKLAGSCQQSDAKADDKTLPFTGEIKDKTVTWKYDVDGNGSTLTAT
jgi:hypothetical protein